MSASALQNQLDQLTRGDTRQLQALAIIAQSVLDGDEPDLRPVLVEALASVVSQATGTPADRLEIGAMLGRLGDPRLHVPADPDYWIPVALEDGHDIAVGRHLVTTAEYQAWVDAGGYADDANWSSDGLAWRDGDDPSWAELAAPADVEHLVVPNQPVVGVTWYEAMAYARAMNTRLLTVAERRWVARGAAKRPYPWGAPFGDGNANTREEALGRPCAVGLYPSDRTPEGVTDLAGNVAEWLGESSGERRMLHPGSWVRPSMASWAKALEFFDPDTRSADLGFRLVRDN